MTDNNEGKTKDEGIIRTWNLAEEESQKTPLRSEHMVQRLQQIRKLDDLYSYNVPERIRKLYDDEKLHQHLLETYKQPYFLVEEVADIKAHVRERDRVIKKGDLQEVTATLVAGKQVRLQSIDKEVNMAKIMVGPYEWDVPIDSLAVIGEHKNGFLGQKDELYPSKFRYKLSSTQFPEEKHIIEYVGQELKQHKGDFIPNKADGIVRHVSSNIHSPQSLYILFARRPGLVQDSHMWFSCEDISLVRPNYVNLDELHVSVENGDGV